MTFNIERRYRYIIQSIFAFLFVYFFLYKLNVPISLGVFSSAIFVVGFSMFSHYPNIKINNLVFSTILPLQLFVGTMLFLKFFPNLSVIFAVMASAGFSAIYYVSSLVDNIFLVVHDREEQIPLYRVALTTSQVLSVAIAIPLFSALFKLNVNAFWQSLFVFTSANFFSIYQFWSLRFDDDTKNAGVGETLLLCFFVSFLTAISNLSVSFLPTESFLRGLFVSCVMMFGLSYVQSHLRNDISKKNLLQHLAIILAFYIILLIFSP